MTARSTIVPSPLPTFATFIMVRIRLVKIVLWILDGQDGNGNQVGCNVLVGLCIRVVEVISMAMVDEAALSLRCNNQQ